MCGVCVCVSACVRECVCVCERECVCVVCVCGVGVCVCVCGVSVCACVCVRVVWCECVIAGWVEQQCTAGLVSHCGGWRSIERGGMSLSCPCA